MVMMVVAMVMVQKPFLEAKHHQVTQTQPWWWQFLQHLAGCRHIWLDFCELGSGDSGKRSLKRAYHCPPFSRSVLFRETSQTASLQYMFKWLEQEGQRLKVPPFSKKFYLLWFPSETRTRRLLTMMIMVMMTMMVMVIMMMTMIMIKTGQTKSRLLVIVTNRR